MRLLLDMPISPHLVRWLNDRGHDSVHASQIGLSTATDREIMALATGESRVVVTADTDFPQLLSLSQAAGPGVILFRGGSHSRTDMQELLLRVFEALPPQVLERAICVVDRDRIRYRMLPLSSG